MNKALVNETTVLGKNICYQISGKILLNGVNLGFFPGEITAILGPSGSGKSTLLKSIGNIYKITDGALTVNNKPLSKVGEDFRQNLGYVPQDDIIHKELTVYQAFYYASKLRLDPALSEEAIEAKINLMIRQLGLDERKFLRIHKLSGGQRKRINIGIELLANPKFIMLDEPASGLDPATEEDLLQLLRDLAIENNTIVLTTHSMQFLELVDRIVIMDSGNLIFAGSLNGLLEHFKIKHPADMFKQLRTNSPDIWKQKYERSAYFKDALKPAKESINPKNIPKPFSKISLLSKIHKKDKS